ncbi:AMP-binding protein [Tsukamurella soli]|uniref:Long-chain acyl-CoA synthetase n=1 Tax=Tsukamurella soli TaxID=644556 RepID=A0ABP8JXG2_9ACTN
MSADVSAYASRPWLALYREGTGPSLVVDHPTMLDAFRAALARDPRAVAVYYFDRGLTFAEIDSRSDALAVALTERGFVRGDRLALYLQNDPAFVIGLVAAWKIGGTAVAVNPMNKARELSYILVDSAATALLCLDELYRDVARAVIDGGGTAVRAVVTYSALDEQTRDDARVFSGAARISSDPALDLESVYQQHAGGRPEPSRPAAGDTAVLMYTSGTTGVPKGAMNTHANLAFNAQTYRDWIGLDADDRVLGVAPLFHITGLVGHIGLAMVAGCPLILAHRFEPGVVLDAIRERRPTFTVGSITVFTALTAIPGVTKGDWSSFRAVFSGGAPIAPALEAAFAEQTGLYIHNIYGLTETSSPSHAVPFGARAPVDQKTGALSVGVPVFDTIVRILGEDGEELPVGEVGEIVVAGPQVVPGYWNRPDATAASLPGGELRTGDVGFMDADGWFYLVDRKKDMINASGYKVWPREVEDVLYGHPAVREVAVVGVPDEYRGETVKAFVSLQPGADVTEDELIDYARRNMAAYKYPRSIAFVPDLPKTVTGKILRRELRQVTA